MVYVCSLISVSFFFFGVAFNKRVSLNFCFSEKSFETGSSLSLSVCLSVSLSLSFFSFFHRRCMTYEIG